ncbi:MAG TPA: AAA domain-containing protein [Puia sp.]|nr:AAA domain-containing protein [Puia sp.]
MDYFANLTRLLRIEEEEDKRLFSEMTGLASVAMRREAGVTWYPVAIRDSEMGRGDYLTIELERTTHRDIAHQLRFGAQAALFSNHDPAADRIEGVIAFQSGDRLRLTLRTDELPDWARDGKLGVDLLFDDNSYAEMFGALRQADKLAEKGTEGRLVRILTGKESPSFKTATPRAGMARPDTASPFAQPAAGRPSLNPSQQAAVEKILSAEDLAIVHGPPGTGKTTTLIAAILALLQRDGGPILVTAPSNTAVDLLSEKLTDAGVPTLRIGNPARVSERLLSLTLDSRMAEHAGMKEIKKLKKRAAEFRDLAHKYKRNFGQSEREQRKALFAEARAVLAEVERMEQYILEDVLGHAKVIAATLVGANHFTIRQLRYSTAVIDEAGQALEPACWIPTLKTTRLVLAGDHCQLPPTVKSEEPGLTTTLLEKCTALHPEAVTLLEEQYRMHERIMGYSSAAFYEARLKAHPSVATHTLFPADPPLLFIDTAGCAFDETPEGTGMTNPEEAAFLLRHLTGLLPELDSRYSGPAFPSIGIISPYRSQVRLLDELVQASPDLQPHLASITVNTIDSFQGQERDIVYIGLTRSNADNRIGFLAEVRRMNVAMTRARKKLVVIGDSATLSRFPFYAGFIDYAQAQDAYVSAWEFSQ